MFRVNLKAMAAAHQLSQGTNLRGHLVWGGRNILKDY